MFGILEYHYGVKLFSIVGALLGFLGVAAGAFGGHALKKILSQEMLSIYEVGVRYQMYHVLALFASAWACTHFANHFSAASGWFFIAGTFLFSGSLYALSLTGIRSLGAITPIGGVLLLAGWILLAIGILRG